MAPQGAGIGGTAQAISGLPVSAFTPQPDTHKHMEAYKRAWKAGKTRGFVPALFP